jgi:hypothetical protein
MEGHWGHQERFHACIFFIGMLVLIGASRRMPVAASASPSISFMSIPILYVLVNPGIVRTCGLFNSGIVRDYFECSMRDDSFGLIYQGLVTSLMAQVAK